MPSPDLRRVTGDVPSPAISLVDFGVTQMRAFRNPAVEQPANEVIPRANQHGHQKHEA